MNEKKETVQEWLDKGNKIKVLPPFLPKIKVYFGKVSSRTRSRRASKGSRK